jgi:two-component system, cell cycle sensor histidine kinase and response regulator CckA
VKKASIMVVEDEGIVGLQIKQSLEARGYDVPVVAHSAEEALRKVTQTEPDLIVLDIRLKGEMSGIEVARRVRATLKIPVIYLTAHSDAETIRQARETEPSGYLVKPFDDRALDAAIQICLFNSERAREARERDRWTSAIPNSISDPVLLSDDKGLVKFVNSAAEQLLGTSLAQVLNRRLGEVFTLLDAQTREPVLLPVTEPLAEGRPTQRMRCIAVGPDGSERNVELTASPLVSAEGTVFGILYVLR